MAEYAYVVMRHMPKSERWTLGSDIRHGVWRGLGLIIKANAVRAKIPILLELDMELKILSASIRTAARLKVVPIKQYEHIAAMMVEIGKMLGGWIKACKG